MMRTVGRTWRKWICAAVAPVLVACGHSDVFAPESAAAGPSGTGPDVRLTFNPDQDYWPIWTQDGQGILYSFVNPGSQPNSRHRCIGLLPAAGGTRFWQLCDDRAVASDTVSSFTAYALGSDGRLLYVEAVEPRSLGSGPVSTLWLADTASPFARTKLLTLPVTVGISVTWLSELAWTGTNSFIALGQRFNTVPHCVNCSTPPDSTFADAGIVVIGTIASGHATLQPVAGSDSATGYSLAENGASIVFIRRDNPQLYKVPVAGGTPTAVATVGGQLVGVSCKAATCVVASDPLTLFFGGDLVRHQVLASMGQGPRELWRVSLTTGAVQVLQTSGPGSPVIVTPQISPVSGDVVAQVGGVWGHLQTFNGGNSDLHLYVGLLP